MDLGILPGILGLVALVVVIGLVLYYISVSSMKEKTYDEVKAEQKKKTEEYLAQGRTAKEKAKDKKLKKAGKKVKEKKSSESVELSSEEGDNSKNHVAFIEPPVIVDVKPAVIEEKKKKTNKKKEKSILVNKNETTPIAETPLPITNHFEQTVPKDDFSLKRSISREEIEVKAVEPQKQSGGKQQKTHQTNSPKETKVEKQPVQKQSQPPHKPAEKVVNASKSEKSNAEKSAVKPQEKAQEKPKPVEEVVEKTVAKQIQNIPSVAGSETPSPSMKSRKKRNELITTLQQMSGDKEAVNVNLLVPLVHKAELSRTDVQVLIELLLNKQQGLSGDSAEWIEGRQDPVVKLKKQLAEKEKALAEEQQAAVALQTKLKELRGELNAERHTTRQMEEGLATRQAELSNLAARLKHTTDEKQGLVQQIQQLQAQLSEEHMLLCKLQDDQGQAQSVMQQELLAQRQQLEMHIARLTEQHQETIAALEAQLSQMSVQLQQQEEIRERALLHDSQDLTRQLKELHAEMERLRSKAQYDTSHLQGEINSLTEQLTLKRTETDKLSSHVQNLQAENNRLTHQVSSACVEAQQLRDENETLAAQVSASMERPATEGRENGDLTYPEIKHIETNSNKDKLHENEVLVEQLKDEIVSKDKEVTRLKSEITQQESLIKSLKMELDLALSGREILLKDINSYKNAIQEHEGVIKALREEGESAHKLVNSLKEELVRLSQDSATREQLESRESTIEKLTSELNTHKTELADQCAIIKTLQAEIEKYKVEATSQQRLDSDELERLRAGLAERESELRNLKVLTEQLRGELTAIKDTSSRLSSERDSLQTQLSTQLLKNDGLRTKNWKAMEALSAAERYLETNKKQSQTLVSETEEKVKQKEQERTKQLLQRLLPHVTIDDKQEYEKWLEQFMSVARVNMDSDNSQAAMLAEVEQQNCQLQAMVTHYKTIIADTEGMLNRLQNHVEQEEERWGQQIQALEAQLQERDRLEAGVKNGVSTVDVGSETN